MVAPNPLKSQTLWTYRAINFLLESKAFGWSSKLQLWAPKAKALDSNPGKKNSCLIQLEQSVPHGGARLS